jgi:hypothetical protein
MATIDHLVYVTPDVESTAQELFERLKVMPSIGGRHVGRGTWNMLLALGTGAYLEIIGPDHDAPEPEVPRPFGLDDIESPRLLTFAVSVADMAYSLLRARQHAYDPGDATAMQRVTPDGVLLSWMLTPPSVDPSLLGVIPFLLDWLDTPPASHPSVTAAAGCRLQSLWVEHPDPERVRGIFGAIECAVAVELGPAPSLKASIESPAGALLLLS